MIYGGAYEILIRASKEATLSKAGKHERGLYLLTPISIPFPSTLLPISLEK
ncbi:hypothetical protein HanXRQr2_Chr17g0817771 [Helianthus annuus]|uniref:Uncharacterized protein n=1 Tax=Helianthus annuus TaxID=4232 RepID=A0A251RTN5_HELAN|nr:hypothetical protein HanXRQr2_Chr17g0817771 [Helianthus annuus]